MIKKSCLLMLFCSLFFIGSAQEQTPYQPMVLEGAHWFINYDYICATPWIDSFFIYAMRGDTVIENLLYKKVYRDGLVTDPIEKDPIFPYQIGESDLVAVVREDTIARKVWTRSLHESLIFYQPCDSNNNETLLYDFSLTPLDTITSCHLRGLVESDQSLVVDSISISNNTFYWENTNRRIIHIYAYFPVACGLWSYTQQRIVEGIGLEAKGLFIQGDGLLGNYCLGTRLDCNVATSVHQVETPNIKFIHDTYSETIWVESSNESHSFSTIHLYDITGQQLATVPVTESISTTDLPQGIYLVQVREKQRLLHLQKIAIQR